MRTTLIVATILLSLVAVYATSETEDPFEDADPAVAEDEVTESADGTAATELSQAGWGRRRRRRYIRRRRWYGSSAERGQKQAAAEKAGKVERSNKERSNKERNNKERSNKERAQKGERTNKERSSKERSAKERQAKERAAKERDAKERKSKESAHKERQAKEKAKKEAWAKAKAREAASKEKAGKAEKTAKEKTAKHKKEQAAKAEKKAKALAAEAAAKKREQIAKEGARKAKEKKHKAERKAKYQKAESSVKSLKKKCAASTKKFAAAVTGGHKAVAAHKGMVTSSINAAANVCKKEAASREKAAKEKAKLHVTGPTFKFKAGAPCKGGHGSFTKSLKKGQRANVGVIPSGQNNVNIELKSKKDVDTELWGKHSKVAVVAWGQKGAKINSAGKKSVKYAGAKIVYSGYNGVGGKRGHEFIKIVGKANKPFMVRAYAYRAGTASITYSWGPDKKKCKALKAKLRKEKKQKFDLAAANKKKLAKKDYAKLQAQLKAASSSCSGAKKAADAAKKALNKAKIAVGGSEAALKKHRNSCTAAISAALKNAKKHK